MLMNVGEGGGTGGHVFVVKLVKYVCFSRKVAWHPYSGGVDILPCRTIFSLPRVVVGRNLACIAGLFVFPYGQGFLFG